MQSACRGPFKKNKQTSKAVKANELAVFTEKNARFNNFIPPN